jgi:hypothetical protein
MSSQTMDPEKRVVQSNQDVYVYGYEKWSGYMVEVVMNGRNGKNLILLLLLKETYHSFGS